MTLAPAGIWTWSAGAMLGDFVAVDDDDLVAEHLAIADIEEMTGADVGVGRRRGEGGGGRNKRDDDCYRECE